MSKRIFIAGLFHETHTFVDETTCLADFTIRRGDEMLHSEGDSSPLGGVLEFAKKQNWEVVPSIDYRCVPSGTVEDEVLEAWWRDILAAWRPDCDAIYLVLHGAMTAKTIRDVEGEMLARIRNLVGEKMPIFGVYDLHANFSPAMAENANCLVAYRENPHVDARKTAISAAKLLAKSFDAAKPKMYLRQANILLPPTGCGTDDEPMHSLESAARSMEGGDIWCVNIAAGFAFGDTLETGLSFQVVTTGSAELAELNLNRLEKISERLKKHGRGNEESLESVMSKLGKPVDGVTILVESADNIGGGAPGDCTGCLRALIDYKTENSAVCINDPKAVKSLRDFKLGAKTKLMVGGNGSCLDAGPVELEVELISRSGGHFELEDKQSHLASMVGDFVDMGDCAIVRHGGITILLTSQKTAPFDLGQWRSQGVEPVKLNVIVVKAAVAHRRGYDPITTRSFWVDTPGPCSSNLKRFSYKYLKREMWPLQEND